MDFVGKKEEIANVIDAFANGEKSKEDLLDKLHEASNDPDFKDKDLFKSLLGEIINYTDDLSPKELRQRALMIRSYME